MPAAKNSPLKTILIAALFIVIICISMLVTFVIVIQVYPKDWQPTTAEIAATAIEPSNEGNITWSLKADIFYELDGIRYDKNDIKILHKDRKEDVVNQQLNWPVGKTFKLFAKSDDPYAISLNPAGDRESTAVMLAILTPAALAVITFPSMLLFRKIRKSSPKRQ
ncbi:hypothetical protein MLD52_07065 [Puniceicoccaceae bacterium K14]|nr:hypothetical protein [Puniceicoccaceae bacterium K14]